jgi:hypothetical protein
MDQQDEHGRQPQAQQGGDDRRLVWASNLHMINVIRYNMMIVIKSQVGGAMPWKKEHKSANARQDPRSRLGGVRDGDVAGVSVAEAMEAAGLTHGGFYAHFKSKDELVADAFEHACEQSGSVLEARRKGAVRGKS